MHDIYNNHEEPIEAMRRITELGKTFSFSHKRLDGTKVIVRKAKLRPMAKSDRDKNAKYKLQYTNEETGALRSCFIPFLLSFNDKLINLSL